MHISAANCYCLLWCGGGYSLEFLSVLGLHVVIIKEEEETMRLSVNEELKPLQY